MSSTNRGTERVEADFYPTPAWCTRAFVTWAVENGLLGNGRVLDPFAGDGAILRVLQEPTPYPWSPTRPLAGIEIRPEAEKHLVGLGGVIGDALAVSLDPWRSWPVITNPPYSIAQECVTRWAPTVPWSAWLLRLNFLGTQERADWIRGYMPAHVLVLPARPKFVAVCKGLSKTKKRVKVKGCGSTYPIGTKGLCPACGIGRVADGQDSCEYAWFVWPGYGQRARASLVEVLDAHDDTE